MRISAKNGSKTNVKAGSWALVKQYCGSFYGSVTSYFGIGGSYYGTGGTAIGIRG